MAKDLEFTAKVAADMSKAARKDDALKKLIDAWNSKNAKAAKRVGTFGFMAAALAACGGGGSGGSGSAGGGNSGGGGNTSSFGVTQVADGETTVSGSFAFFDRTAATITSITADPDDIADKFLVDVDQLDVLGDPVSVAGVTKINLSGGVTLVATIEDLAPLVQVTGSGNVWVLIGAADLTRANHGSFELDIDITGNLIFDMDGDEREIGGIDVEQKVAVTGTIDLNGGDIRGGRGNLDQALRWIA
jgi:phage baseplate assembly protein gpV